jgi:hypothetical protein
MSTHYVPPRDPNKVRLEQIETAIVQVLINGHISGRGKETKAAKAAAEIITVLGPLLKLAPKADKGATVMTPAASMRNEETGTFRKGPSNL